MIETYYITDFAILIIKAAAVVVGIAVVVAALVYIERKIIACAQLRKGPNVVGPFGILQSVADALKSVFKETIIPSQSRHFVFLMAPLITFVAGFASWAVIPFGDGLVFADLNVGVIYVLAMSAIGVYGIVFAGWASNSKYAFFGAIRSASQMISYEIPIGIGILCVATLSGSLNLTNIVNAQKNMWFIVPLFPIFVIFTISTLAEINRHPFDLPEAENELVAGYNVEYSSMAFTMFFLVEYANMALMAVFCSLLFLGGWLPPFNLEALAFVPSFLWLTIKAFALIVAFIWMRIALPRYRYDQLTKLGWGVFTPISLVYFGLVATVTTFWPDLLK